MNDEMQGSGKKWYRHVLRNWPGEMWGVGTAVRISGLGTWNQAQYFPNTNLKTY